MQKTLFLSHSIHPPLTQKTPLLTHIAIYPLASSPSLSLIYSQSESSTRLSECYIKPAHLSVFTTAAAGPQQQQQQQQKTSSTRRPTGEEQHKKTSRRGAALEDQRRAAEQDIAESRNPRRAAEKEGNSNTTTGKCGAEMNSRAAGK